MRFGNKLASVLALIRWENALLSVAGVVLGAWWATGRPNQPETIVMAGVAILLTAFANADNDVRDFEIDRIAHPARPLPAGTLSIDTARIVVGLSAAGALVLASLLGGAQTLAAVGVIAAITPTAASVFAPPRSDDNTIAPAALTPTTMRAAPTDNAPDGSGRSG